MFDYRRKPKVDVDLHHTAHSQTQAAWVSAIAAFLSILMSIIALYQTGRVRDESKKEIVKLEVYRDTTANPKPVRTRHGAYYIPGTTETTWYLIIENRGDTPISVTGYKATAFLQNGSTTLYTGCDLDHDRQRRMPTLNIRAKSSLKLKVLVGMIEKSRHLDRIATKSPFPGMDQPDYRQGIEFLVYTMNNPKSGYRTQLASGSSAKKSLPS